MSEIDDINKLQEYEQKLMDKLATVPEEEKQSIIDKIKEIGQMKIRFYESIKDKYLFYNNQLFNTDKVLKEQNQAMIIINKELNNIKENKLKIENDILKNNKQIQINQYYGLYYQSHAEVFKIIIYCCLFIIFVLFIKKKGILPSKISIILIIISFLIAIIMIVKKVWNLYWRDDTNFNQYSWIFDKSNYSYV
uniref:Uncharacterized protein n=1 Tax=viral metagenome TaxID=1070528 RepID=A0A6C0H6D6_9ZZZZ